MKRKCHLLRAFVLTFLSLLVSGAVASATPADSSMLSRADSVEISLLTCGPGQETYSLYGHTALRIKDRATGEDMAVNWGMFSFSQPHFVLRFVFGLTDYEMGIVPFSLFMQEYMAEGRWVREQRLSLTPGEKMAVCGAVAENYLPEHRTYRYNYFYDNCTTRARDMIVSHLSGAVSMGEAPAHTSLRQMTHQWTAGHPWGELGNDLLLGVAADREASWEERQFLPDSLSRDFDRAIVTSPDGMRRRLVEESLMLFAPVPQSQVPAPLSPVQVAWLFAGLLALVTAAEWWLRRVWWGIDALLLLLTGLGGVVLGAMVFSAHPTVSVNFQILFFSPLSLVALWPVCRRLRRGQGHWYLPVASGLILLMLALGLWQDYPAAIEIVAAAVAARYVYRVRLNLRLRPKSRVVVG